MRLSLIKVAVRVTELVTKIKIRCRPVLLISTASQPSPRAWPNCRRDRRGNAPRTKPVPATHKPRNVRPPAPPLNTPYARVATRCRARNPCPLAARRYPDPGRQPLRPTRGHGVVRAQSGRLHLRLGRQQGTAALRNGVGQAGCLGSPRRARREQGAALCRVLVRPQDLEDRAPSDRPSRSFSQG